MVPEQAPLISPQCYHVNIMHLRRSPFEDATYWWEILNLFWRNSRIRTHICLSVFDCSTSLFELYSHKTTVKSFHLNNPAVSTPYLSIGTHYFRLNFTSRTLWRPHCFKWKIAMGNFFLLLWIALDMHLSNMCIRRSKSYTRFLVSAITKTVD